VTQARVLWRRLDAPGHDACRLTRVAAGWRLEGSAVSLESGVPARLDYRVTCDRGWRSQRGQVRGWFGERAVVLTVVRDAGGWTVNGERAAGLEDCVDLDFGFTPATNLLPIRRLHCRSERQPSRRLHGLTSRQARWSLYRNAMSGERRTPSGTRPRASGTPDLST